MIDPWKQLLGRLYVPLVKEWLLREKLRGSGGMGEHAFRTIHSVTPELVYDEAAAAHHYRELLRERRGQT